MAVTVKNLSIEVLVRGLQVAPDGNEQEFSKRYAWNFSHGTGEEQVGAFFWDENRRLNNTSEDLDFGTGGLDDIEGTDLVFNNGKVLMLKNRDEDTGDNVLLKRGASNPVTTILGGTAPTFTLGPGGFLLAINPLDGWTITDGSADTLGLQTTDDVYLDVLFAGDRT